MVLILSGPQTCTRERQALVPPPSRCGEGVCQRWRDTYGTNLPDPTQPFAAFEKLRDHLRRIGQLCNGEIVEVPLAHVASLEGEFGKEGCRVAPHHAALDVASSVHP